MQKNKLKEKIQHIIRLFLFYKQIALPEVKGTICTDRKFQESLVIERMKVVGTKSNTEHNGIPLVILCIFFNITSINCIMTQSQYTIYNYEVN